MFTAVGFIALSEYLDPDDEFNDASAEYEEIAQLVSSLDGVDTQKLNGTTYLQILIDCNHPGDSLDELQSLFTFIADRTPGSNGIMHVNDDEGSDPNNFTIWKLAKGQVTHHPDPFLSPINPTIEL